MSPSIKVLTDISDVVTVYALNVEVIKSSVPIEAVLLNIPALVAIDCRVIAVRHPCDTKC